mgnify:CR=1 FL=1
MITLLEIHDELEKIKSIVTDIRLRGECSVAVGKQVIQIIKICDERIDYINEVENQNAEQYGT